MLRNVLLKKTIVVFLIVLMLTNVCAPTISWALTSGPTAPEATSFEPVDTTDMVNLATGDFVYNLPLLEVPGPAGGYPLSLSYHAGIQPNEDASWVGLGWTLNPGAIARTINGYPDDQLGAIRTRHDYNSGGSRNTFSLGVGVPGASFNLSVSNDSNLGLGVGTSMTIGAAFGVGGPNSGVSAGISASVGDDPFGGGYASANGGISAGPAGVKLGIDSRDGASGQIGIAVSNSLRVGIQTDFKSAVGYADLQFGRLGTSISSKGLKPNLSVSGFQIGQVNSNSGRWTTKGWGISTPPIPVGPFTLTLGYNYMRYYSDETSNVSLIGTLKASNTNGKNPDTWAFDSYALLDPDAEGGVIKNNDPEKSKGGSFPAYDSYSVMAQGLGGSIQPYILENGTLFRQNLKNQPNNGDIIYNKVNNSFNFSKPVNFRFKNDFSNSYTFNQAAMRVASNGTTVAFEGLTPISTPPQGFNSAANHLAGSKHIEYFTNQQILDGFARDKGFVDSNPNTGRAITRYGYNIADQVGGFMITNESGVTYHYSLPVYAYNQVSKSFVTGKEGDVFQKNSENHPYAYTWFLTAVTGPDYVNRNTSNDGTISKQDWGYWVKFTYALHLDNYTWRNPVVGTHKDIDRDIESYSFGQKELYYLNSISTATHVAYFEKSGRLDGRGVTSGINGGFGPMSQTNCYTDPNCNPNDCTEPDPRVCDGYCQICETTPSLAGKTLKLDKIYLLSAVDYESGVDYVAKALRVVSLTTDYSLTPGTMNSFSDSNPTQKEGKLSLKSIKFLGKGGADIVPPISFQYGKNPGFNKDAYDIWGLYKNDYVNLNNENLSRLVTSQSAQSVDAWSLTRIVTSLGSEIAINYESDTYKKPVLYKSNILNVESVTPNVQNGSVKIRFHNQGINLTDMINIEDNISLMGVISYPFYKVAFGYSCDGQQVGAYGENYKSVNFSYADLNIESVGVDYLDIYNVQLYNDITMVLGQYPLPATLPYPKNNSSVPCYNTSGQEVVHNVTYTLSPRWMGGNASIENSTGENFGGGLRVSSISLIGSSSTNVTKYSYENGTTSYEPIGLDIHILQHLENITNNSGNPWEAIITKRQKAIDSYLSNLNGQFSKLLNVAREVPAPGVLYSRVTVKEEIRRIADNSFIEIPGKKVFEFQVFDEGIVERLGITTTSSTGLYAAECFDSSGNPTYCGPPPPNPGPPPVFCKDQNGNTISCSTFGGTVYSPLTLKDFSAWVGALKSVTTYGPNDEILEKTMNQYLHENKTNAEFDQQVKTKFNGQGIISQTFTENRTSVGYVFSRRDEYPLVSIGQTSTNYKTGITVTSQNLAFDFYTGNPLKVLSIDGYGNKYVSESTPAYTIADYSGMTSTQIANGFTGMGLKVNNPKNKHMITQAVSSQTFKVNDNYITSGSNADKLALVSASAQTWSDQVPVLAAGAGGANSTQPGVWRQRANFNFIADDNISLRPDGLYPYANFTEFNAWTGTGDVVTANWKKLSEIKLFDTYSHALEASDMNGNFAATKMSLDQTRVFATVSNANYHEFAYSGIEETPDVNNKVGGGVKVEGNVISTVAHTGQSSVQANAGSKGFSYTFNNASTKKYRLSVWSNQPDASLGYSVNGVTAATPVPLVKQAGAWYLIEAEVELPAGSINVWCQAVGTVSLFDDFRVHPLKSAMVSYVYNKWGELTHMLNNNNLFTEYEYDGMGRLTKVYRETFQHGKTKTSETQYHYANQ